MKRRGRVERNYNDEIASKQEKLFIMTKELETETEGLPEIVLTDL